MTFTELKEKIKGLPKKEYFPKILIGIGLAAMLLILFSGISQNDEDNSSASDINSDFLTADTYTEQTEQKLEKILNSIEGVGKTDVLVNVSSTEEYIYAEEIRRSAEKSENEYVIIDNGSTGEALVKKVTNPPISGIIIVCEGGDDPKICEKVYKAVSTALNIPTNRIYVTEMK